MLGPVRNNRRLYFRQPMYLRIDLRVSGVRVAVPATLIDISGGGCRIHARTMIKSRAAVEFDLPRPGGPALRIAGVVNKVAYTPEDRTFRYAVAFETLDEEVRDRLLRFIVEEQRRAIKVSKAIPEAAPRDRTPPTRLRELRAAHRVEVNVPVRYSVGDGLTMFDATAVDVSAGGMRLILDQVLRQEWRVVVRFTLPNDTLKALAQAQGGSAPAMRPFSELKLAARPLPGVKQSRGRFVQSLAFEDPDPKQTQEIDRFIAAAKLTALRRA